jgi:hypothetical protein
MDVVTILWLVGFAILLLSINVVYTLIISYTNDKPLGFQSLLDAVVRDYFRLVFYLLLLNINAEVVTCVVGSLEAGGLPGYPESLFVEIKVMKA